TLQDQGSDEEVDSDFSPSTREFTVNLGNADILNSDAGFVDTSFLFWQNPRNRFDVNDDNTVEPLDVLQLVNYINIHNSGALPIPPGPDGPPPYVDVSGDNRVAPIDALQLINFINNSLAQGQGQGQGEGIVDLVATDVATAQDGSRDGQALLANDDAIVQWANGPTTRESISLEARSDSGSESLDDILGVIAADIAMG
ncbi:MAG: hypothetical protein ACI9HK_001402, partial [Pirellulaceae bacterium]